MRCIAVSRAKLTTLRASLREALRHADDRRARFYLREALQHLCAFERRLEQEGEAGPGGADAADGIEAADFTGGGSGSGTREAVEAAEFEVREVDRN